MEKTGLRHNRSSGKETEAVQLSGFFRSLSSLHSVKMGRTNEESRQAKVKTIFITNGATGRLASTPTSTSHCSSTPGATPGAGVPGTSAPPEDRQPQPCHQGFHRRQALSPESRSDSHPTGLEAQGEVSPARRISETTKGRVSVDHEPSLTQEEDPGG